MHRRVSRSALMVVLVLLVTSGCFRMQMEMTINDDETLSGSLVTAMSVEALEQMAAFGDSGSGDPRSLWEEFNEDSGMDLPPGATREPYEEDGYIGDRIVFEDTPIAEMSSVMGADGGDFSLVRDGDTYVFSMSFTLDDAASTGEDELLSGTELRAFAAIYGKPELIVRVTFPGEVIEHNGEVDGTTVSWTRDLLASNSEPMTATAKDSGGTPSGNGNGSGSDDTGSDDGNSAASDEDASAAVVAGVGLGAAILVMALVGMGMGVHRALRG